MSNKNEKAKLDKTVKPLVKNNMKERIKEKAEQEKLDQEKIDPTADNPTEQLQSDIDPAADNPTEQLNDSSDKETSDKETSDKEPSKNINKENTKVLVKEDSKQGQDNSGRQKKKKGIFSNLGLTLIALLAAFVLWFIVMNIF